ncbi:hypothetical protein HanXRQr2_Chr03g0133771 [Helianthus annuus]|uniref:Uncharacterized protein n=1 Tax=Helianthus annuus TaxID=4232 RepID=A0A9K3JL46_HELAN|nr:hypothetical protein HanXRQr2_Chr03g0133771 [Helianthus annuus]
MLSDPPDETEYVEPFVEMGAKKPFGGSLYIISSENVLSRPFFGGLPNGLCTFCELLPLPNGECKGELLCVYVLGLASDGISSLLGSVLQFL